MAYVPVPKDLTKVKTKVMFNLTRRQLVCFTAGALVGVPLFLWLREPAGNSMAAMCMMLVMMPFFLLAMYEKHGQPLEKIVGNILKVAVIRPKQRPYQTNNFYAVLKRQEMLDKEVLIGGRSGLEPVAFTIMFGFMLLIISIVASVFLKMNRFFSLLARWIR